MRITIEANEYTFDISNLELEMKMYRDAIEHTRDLEQKILLMLEYSAFQDTILLELWDWRTDEEGTISQSEIGQFLTK